MIFPGKHSWVVLPVAPGQASGTHAGSVNQLIGFISLIYKNLNSCVFFFSNHDLCTGGSYILRKQLHFLFLPLLLKVRAAHPSRLHAQRSERLTGTLLGSSAAPDLREHTDKDSLSSFLFFFVPPSSSPFKFCRSGLGLGARRPRRRPATTRLCGSRCPSAL